MGVPVLILLNLLYECFSSDTGVLTVEALEKRSFSQSQTPEPEQGTQSQLRRCTEQSHSYGVL